MCRHALSHHYKIALLATALSAHAYGETEPALIGGSVTDSVLSEVLGESTPAIPPRPAVLKTAGTARDMPPSWRSRYELGAGDVLNFGLSGKPTLVAAQVPVAPDGTISYLQAKRVSVIGKTIGELRDEMQSILSAYYKGQGNQKGPGLIITPAKVGSKKYTIMGQVHENGTFPMERPISLIEVIARSKGIAVGITADSAMELADFRRSFIVRSGRKLKVDFERLYLKGDLTQNIQIEPGDYIYVASKLATEYYVFGAVTEPGLKPLAAGTTVTGAIASAQGFNKSAWKSRVLIVRGSLSQPQGIAVDMADVLHGKSKDVPLEPGDIVYVHTRPWAFIEELTDIAVKAFIDGAVTGAIYPESVAISTGRSLSTP
jgi:protein involved in polysaccharide export with SLBB domain